MTHLILGGRDFGALCQGKMIPNESLINLIPVLGNGWVAAPPAAVENSSKSAADMNSSVPSDLKKDQVREPGSQLHPRKIQQGFHHREAPFTAMTEH